MSRPDPTFNVNDDEFDKGITTGTFHNHIDVSKLKKAGHAIAVHISPEDLSKTLGVANPDLVDIEGVSTKIYSNPHPYAISYSCSDWDHFNTKGHLIPTGLNIENNTLYLTKNAKAYAHAIGVPNHTTETGPHKVQDGRHNMFEDSEAERKVTKDLTETIKKRTLPQYRNAKPGDVSIGTKKVTHVPSSTEKHVVYRTGTDSKGNVRKNTLFQVFEKMHADDDLHESVTAIGTGQDLHFVCADPEQYSTMKNELIKATQCHTPIGKHGIIVKATLLKDKTFETPESNHLDVQTVFSRGQRWNTASNSFQVQARENGRISMADVNPDAATISTSSHIAPLDPAAEFGFDGHDISELEVEEPSSYKPDVADSEIEYDDEAEEEDDL